MSAIPATAASAHGEEAGVRRLRVFYLRVNGRRRVVLQRRLYDAMRDLKLMNLHRVIDRLSDGASLEFNVLVHRHPVNLLATAGVWRVHDAMRLESRETP